MCACVVTVHAYKYICIHIYVYTHACVCAIYQYIHINTYYEFICIADVGQTMFSREQMCPTNRVNMCSLMISLQIQKMVAI